MNAESRLQLLWAGAAALLLAGLVWGAFSIQNAGNDRARIERKLADIVKLQKMAARRQYLDEAVRLCAESSKGKPAAIAEVVKSFGGDPLPEVREREPEESAEGWMVHRADIAWSGLPLEKLAEVITRVEALRPPWRVVECSIQSSTQPGSAQVKLLVESLGH